MYKYFEIDLKTYKFISLP